MPPIFHLLPPPPSVLHACSEADKLEQAEEESKNHDAFADMGTPELRAVMMGLGGTLGTADGRAVVICNAQGIIQMTNQGCQEQFGYSKTELRGKNVAMLMPQPMASAHTGFLRSYITTGREVVMNRTTQMVGLHKDRRFLALQITVTRVSGIGEDTVLMGILEELLSMEDTARLWVSLTGEIMSCDEVASDWSAYSAQEVQGLPVVSMAVKGGAALEDALKRARASLLLAAHNQQKQEGATHQSGDAPLPTAMSRMGGAARSKFGKMSQGDELEAAGLVGSLLSGPSRAASRLFAMVQDEAQTEWAVQGVQLGHKFAVGSCGGVGGVRGRALHAQRCCSCPCV